MDGDAQLLDAQDALRYSYRTPTAIAIKDNAEMQTKTVSLQSGTPSCISRLQEREGHCCCFIPG